MGAATLAPDASARRAKHHHHKKKHHKKKHKRPSSNPSADVLVVGAGLLGTDGRT